MSASIKEHALKTFCGNFFGEFGHLNASARITMNENDEWTTANSPGLPASVWAKMERLHVLNQ